MYQKNFTILCSTLRCMQRPLLNIAGKESWMRSDTIAICQNMNIWHCKQYFEQTGKFYVKYASARNLNVIVLDLAALEIVVLVYC